MCGTLHASVTLVLMKGHSVTTGQNGAWASAAVWDRIRMPRSCRRAVTPTDNKYQLKGKVCEKCCFTFWMAVLITVWFTLFKVKALCETCKGKGVPLHAKKAQRRGRGVAVPILEPGARRGWVVSATHLQIYLREREAVPITDEDVWGSRVTAPLIPRQ